MEDGPRKSLVWRSNRMIHTGNWDTPLQNFCDRFSSRFGADFPLLFESPNQNFDVLYRID